MICLDNFSTYQCAVRRKGLKIAVLNYPVFLVELLVGPTCTIYLWAPVIQAVQPCGGATVQLETVLYAAQTLVFPEVWQWCMMLSLNIWRFQCIATQPEKGSIRGPITGNTGVHKWCYKNWYFLSKMQTSTVHFKYVVRKKILTDVRSMRKVTLPSQSIAPRIKGRHEIFLHSTHWSI